jgi:Fur family ferric uptake transcriptional regulator
MGNDEGRGDASHLLRQVGLRVTAPRLAVMAVTREKGHVDADEVAAVVRERLGAVSTQTVYDALHTLADHGLLRKIEPAGSPMLFEARTGDNHHHVVCRRCHAIADVDCARGEAPCLDASNPAGYVIDEAEVTYWGLCPACQAHEERGKK